MPKLITGELVQVGTDPETGLCRAIVKLDPRELQEVEWLPMYRRVQIVQVVDPSKG